MSDIFAGLTSPNLSTTALDPKRLFRILTKPTSSPFKFPHDIQTEVWDQWFDRRNEADLIVKMNTGSGKTVIGLLILKSSLNENVGPAVYLVPNKQLKAQVGAAAEQLGILWTDDPSDPAFRQGQAILVATVQTMYNGLSKFGVRGAGGRRQIEVGTIIVDDAHACIPIIREQFSLLLPREIPAYKALLSIFEDALKQQSLTGFSALRDGDGSQAVPVPYWAWRVSQQASLAAINGVTDEEYGDFKFKWPLIRQQFALCEAAFSPKEVEIRLPYPDLSAIPSFVNAKRRIFMTATLADDALLVAQMGVAEDCVTAPITPASASDLGDRIILTPMETSRLIVTNDVKASAVRWSQTLNVVVIVPSEPRAESWRDVTQEIHYTGTVEDCVDRLKSGHVGLVVLVARYDGLDLPNDACRLLILDGLPERYTPQELVEAVALGGTEAMDSRQTQRIEQGMGRGIRANDDYCVVLLLDPRLVDRLHTASDRSQLSPGTRAQYELSVQFAAAGRGKPMHFFDEAIGAFLQRSPSWMNASKQAIEHVVYTSIDAVDPILVAERDAFRFALAERSAEAFDTLSSVYDEVSDPQERGWAKQRAATYLDHLDPERAREIQHSARIDNSFVLKTGQRVHTTRIKAVNSQADNSVRFLRDSYQSARSLEVAVDALLSDLTPNPTPYSHKSFEAALAKVGRILGMISSRPDQELGVGPDNLWAIGGGAYWVIECKSEAVAAQVSLDYLQQLSGSVDWFDSVYKEPEFSALPVMIHPSRQPMWDASVRQGARIMTFEKLAEFRSAVRGFTAAIRENDNYRSAAVVASNLTQFGLSANQLPERWTQTFTLPATRP